MEELDMTREQFDAFRAEVRARGFDAVKTGGGVVPLEEWRPYGAFGGGNPGIGEYMGEGFRWIGPDRAADIPLNEPPDGVGIGVWTFLRSVPSSLKGRRT
jgi:hypothetical protein